MVEGRSDASAGGRIRYGMVGGGQGAFIGAVHRLAARMDDQFDAAERATIERLLTERFDLTPDALHALMDAAETAVRQSTQLFPFTRQIVQSISHEDRAHILEMMWEVAYADGVLDPHEDALLRRIAGLIHVPDQERGLARQRALEKAKNKRPRGQ